MDTRKRKTTSNPVPPQANPASKTKDGFTQQHYLFLCENENSRYIANNRLGFVGHAVIFTEKNGEKKALQFQFPESNSKDAPRVVQLSSIEQIERWGQKVYRAKTLDGVTVYARRMINAKINLGKQEEDAEVAYFSPNDERTPEPFFGGGRSLPLFKPKSEEIKQDLDAELAEIKHRQKGGKEVTVDPESVRFRDENKTRNPDQNTVMGESALKAYEAFFDQWNDEFDKDIRDWFERSIKAPLGASFNSNHRPEWLHAEGFSLTHADQNPQRKSNLGAAPKWANTEMMVLERVAKWFALNRSAVTTIKFKPIFDMLKDSELIEHINFSISLEETNNGVKRLVKFMQDYDIFQKFPMFRKPSDLAQTTGIAYHFLQGTPPISVEPVKNIKSMGVPKGSAPAPIMNATSLADLVAKPAPAASVPPAAAGVRGEEDEELSFTQSDKQDAELIKWDKPVELAKLTAVDSSKKISKKHPSPKVAQAEQVAAYPTQLKFEKSVVKILTTLFEPNYEEPWNGSRTMSCSGTGLVIQQNGKKYILTNAHCVENHKLLRTRFANDHQHKYEVNPIVISYQCDLALLEVDDPQFNELAEPVELGEMVSLQNEVQTVGFPMGGEEVSISKGIVSRIEVRPYCMSELDMLQVQVDAAINPGNSGGPVFSNGKVVGVAFQGYDKQGLGFMIPIPIIKHFLKEALDSKANKTKYRGFPELPLQIQNLQNPDLRAANHMSAKASGVLISKIDDLSDAFKKLKTGDILLEIDGHRISNQGTVDIEGVGKCIDYIHITHQKYIGDSVNLKVLRHENGKPKIMNIDVILDCIPDETLMIQTEHDKLPTYFIASGISFMPVTRNYVENGKGTEFENALSAEYGTPLTEVAKKNPTDEYVAINDILDCANTVGYDNYAHGGLLVKEVNGKKITNLQDVISAIENNVEAFHTIKAGSKILTVKNMSKQEHQKLLDHYNIPFDRSIDLRNPGELTERLEKTKKSVPKPAAASRPQVVSDAELATDSAVEDRDISDEALEVEESDFGLKSLRRPGPMLSRTYADTLSNIIDKLGMDPDDDGPDVSDLIADEEEDEVESIQDADLEIPASGADVSDKEELEQPAKKSRLQKLADKTTAQETSEEVHEGRSMRPRHATNRFAMFNQDRATQAAKSAAKRKLDLVPVADANAPDTSKADNTRKLRPRPGQ